MLPAVTALRVVHAIRTEAFAGVERHVCVLARAQAAAGHRVVVIGGDPQVMPRELGPEVTFVRARTTLDVVRGLRRWRGADVVHAHMTAAEAAAALTVSRGSALVVTRHFAARRGKSALGRAVSPVIRRRVREQIAISRYVAEHIDGTSTVVYPGVEPAEGGPGAREQTILAAQRLEAEKGVDVVLRAFAASGLGARGWRLLVVGEGSCQQELESLARAEGVASSVDFLGHREDVPAIMGRCSIFVSACPVEGLGLAVIEAMAAGLPVVTTAAGGHLETVGLTGGRFLFTPGDHAGAAELLRQLAGDPILRSELGDQLRALQRERFTPQRQERDTTAVYERALG